MTSEFSRIPDIQLSGTPGLFVVLEGIDGSGTTSQMKRVSAQLEARGHRVHSTQQPSHGPIGKQIREALAEDSSVSPETLALLFAADRLDHYQREILPAVSRGEVVVCDRYLFSSWAYQPLSIDRPQSSEWVHEINRFATFPNCTIILDVDPEIAAARLVARGGKRERFDALETQKRVAANYRAIGNSCFDGNGCVWPVYTIDGELSMDTVTHAILDIVETHLS